MSGTIFYYQADCEAFDVFLSVKIPPHLFLNLTRSFLFAFAILVHFIS